MMQMAGTIVPRYISTAILILLCAMLGGCMDMDGFLFNVEKLDHYALPGLEICATKKPENGEPTEAQARCFLV